MTSVILTNLRNHSPGGPGKFGGNGPAGKGRGPASWKGG